MKKLNSNFAPLALLLATVLIPFSLSAADLPANEEAFFENKVRPLLAEHCYDCHSEKAKKIKGGLLLDSSKGWRAGGDSGDAIEPGKPGKSLLMETVKYADPDLQMPPKYKLKAQEIDVLEKWIAMGAPDPRTGASPKAVTSAGDPDKGKDHWAFQPVKKQPIPQVKNAAWSKNDLDRFILAGIENANISPAPDATRFTLIRRATFDLIGLPPTVAEVTAFAKDSAENDVAFAKVVDRLLASPQYGERWGRHWLDIARYADSVGRTRNVPFPYAWRYRNYVFDSFNKDKPYRVFIGEQVAGDLMKARDQAHQDELRIATGYLALGSMDLNERDKEQFMLDRVDDQVDTLGRSVLALTAGCARCHDHKFDPVSQKDYYALAGIFASTDTLSGQTNKGGGGNYTNANLLASLGKSETPKPAGKQVAAKANNPQVVQARKRQNQLQTQLKAPGLTAKKRKALLSQAAQLKKRIAVLEKGGGTAKPKTKKKSGGGAIDPNASLAMSARDGRVEDLALRVRGEPDIKGKVVPRGFPAILCADSTQPTLSSDASGRLEMARWLTDPAHPLTARVMVNRIWAHLFGRGIVPTLDNFGVAGEVPTHPGLLDHLAIRFVENGWSVKKTIREIMLSRSYRMSSDHIPANSEVDESNRLFWQMNLRRMEAEAIRDSLLAAGGRLELKRPEGSPFGNGRLASSKNGITGNGGDQAFSQPIRSVYLPVLRSRLPGMFTVFDFAEPSMVNGQRDVTTVAPQALFLLNNKFAVESAELAAKRILAIKLPDEAAQIRYAYAFTLSRKPEPDELSRAAEFLNSDDDWPAFVQALYSTAEFRYIR